MSLLACIARGYFYTSKQHCLQINMYNQSHAVTDTCIVVLHDIEILLDQYHLSGSNLMGQLLYSKEFQTALHNSFIKKH